MADVIERIKNLIALSKNNNSPEEAALAAARAQELIFKHEIDEADLNLSEDEHVAEAVVDEAVIVEKSSKRCAWKAQLGNSLAMAFGCRLYTWRTGECEYRVVGLKSSVQTVGYLFAYLCREVDRLADEAWKAARARGDHGTMGQGLARTWKNSFRLGAINTICARVRKQREEQDAQVESMLAAAKAAHQTEKVTALALYKTNRERVDEGYKKVCKERKLRTAHTSYRRFTPTAFDRGRKAGESVSLSSSRNSLGADPRRITG